MRVIVTGSSGRIGRAIFGALAGTHEVIGVDHNVFSTTYIVGDCADVELMKRAMEGADAVIHAAGPHAPHVGIVPDAEFERVNIEGTNTLFALALEAGVSRFVYTSTTALYGHAIKPGACAWVDEETPPQPYSIYHRTKLAAEMLLEEFASEQMPVRVMRMSRCFPEPAPLMCAYRLHRGVDARDVASGHALALTDQGAPFERFILSGPTPFDPQDCEDLSRDAEGVLRHRVRELVSEFDARGWPLPKAIDRVYSSQKAQDQLGWQPRWLWAEVLAQRDRSDLEVLPANASISEKSE